MTKRDSSAQVANIDERGQRRRLTGGVVWLGVAAAASAVLAATHARDAWYAVLFAPFTLAALGYFQAKQRT